jgi:hypothetical protein
MGEFGERQEYFQDDPEYPDIASLDILPSLHRFYLLLNRQIESELAGICPLKTWRRQSPCYSHYVPNLLQRKSF